MPFETRRPISCDRAFLRCPFKADPERSILSRENKQGDRGLAHFAVGHQAKSGSENLFHRLSEDFGRARDTCGERNYNVEALVTRPTWRTYDLWSPDLVRILNQLNRRHVLRSKSPRR